jgi:hypothetical protein
MADARLCIKVWSAVEDALLAAQVYSAIHDALHGLCGYNTADGTIVRALEVSGPMEMTDPDTGWVSEYAFYQVMVRPNAPSVPYVPQFYEGLSTGNIYEMVAGVWLLIGNIPTTGVTDALLLGDGTDYLLLADGVSDLLLGA